MFKTIYLDISIEEKKELNDGQKLLSFSEVDMILRFSQIWKIFAIKGSLSPPIFSAVNA